MPLGLRSWRRIWSANGRSQGPCAELAERCRKRRAAEPELTAPQAWWPDARGTGKTITPLRLPLPSFKSGQLALPFLDSSPVGRGNIHVGAVPQVCSVKPDEVAQGLGATFHDSILGLPLYLRLPPSTGCRPARGREMSADDRTGADDRSNRRARRAVLVGFAHLPTPLQDSGGSHSKLSGDRRSSS